VLGQPGAIADPPTLALLNEEPTIFFATVTGRAASLRTVFWTETAAVPFPPVTPSRESDETYTLTIARHNSSYTWMLGSIEYPFDQVKGDEPLLFHPSAAGNSDSWNIRTKNGSWVDLIIKTEGMTPPHPIHKHSSKFFVLGQGTGPFRYSSVADAIAAQPASFNVVTPPIRDTYSTPAGSGDGSWLVLRYHVVNPGAFLLHCHIQVHLEGGMAVNLLDGIDTWPAVPPKYLDSHGF